MEGLFMRDVKEVNIEKEIHKNLGMRSTAEIFFNNLDSNFSKIIIDFKDVEFVSRSFAQEYVYQKKQRNSEIIEKNMSEFVKNMLDIVTKDYENYLENL